MPLLSFPMTQSGPAIVIAAQPEDSAGNPGQLQVGQTPSWAVNSNSNPNVVASLTPAGDGLSATVTPGAGTGVAQIDVTGETPTGGNPIPFVSSFDVSIPEGPATQFGFSLVS